MRPVRLLVLIVSLSILHACGGSNSSPQNYTTAEAYLESEDFIGSILIKKNNTDILRKGFGFADKIQQLQNNIDTRYRIGSLTKAFTALAIVQLKNNNLISSYDDPVSNYIPDYPRGEHISIRDLLTHRSGIPDYLSDVNPNDSYTPSNLVNLFKNEALDFEPGEEFRYSNSNYILLGYLIEVLSGLSYDSYQQTSILAPLGMAYTEYGSSTIDGVEYAKGYQNTLQAQTAGFYDMSIPFAAGALSSNIGDLEIWAQSFSAETLVSSQDNQEIFSEGGYGFGWIDTKIAGKTAHVHAGGISGFSSFIAILPQEKGLLIALSNVEGEHSKLDRIAKAIIENEI